MKEKGWEKKSKIKNTHTQNKIHDPTKGGRRGVITLLSVHCFFFFEVKFHSSCGRRREREREWQKLIKGKKEVSHKIKTVNYISWNLPLRTYIFKVECFQDPQKGERGEGEWPHYYLFIVFFFEVNSIRMWEKERERERVAELIKGKKKKRTV